MKMLFINVKKSDKLYPETETSVPYYTTTSIHRAKVLIINNINFKDSPVRRGAKIDENNLVQLFNQIENCSVTVQNDLKASEMISNIHTFTEDSSLVNYDICIIVMMSHGYGYVCSDSTVIVGIDDKQVGASTIAETFSNCKYLMGKPKILIFQCCRGNADYVQPQMGLEFDYFQRYSDILLAFGTLPGYVSRREHCRGTYYIRALCKVFMEHAHEIDVENMLKIVNEKMKENPHQQISCYENKRFKLCYLNPGIYKRNFGEIVKTDENFVVAKVKSSFNYCVLFANYIWCVCYSYLKRIKVFVAYNL